MRFDGKSFVDEICDVLEYFENAEEPVYNVFEGAYTIDRFFKLCSQ